MSWIPENDFQDLMTPVIKNLRAHYAELQPLTAESGSFDWLFNQKIRELGSDFYKKAVSYHPLLNLEYSVICHQLHHNFSHPQEVTAEQIRDRLITALTLADLLEHIHLYYLDVPREVLRLRRHQKIFKELLKDSFGYQFGPEVLVNDQIHLGISLSQHVRENTMITNWYRLFIVRTKRALNLLNVVLANTPSFNRLIALVDQYMNPVLVHVGWGFYLPRLLTNLYLLLKHTLPWPFLREEEKTLGWFIRLQAQLQRRWFELGNDSIWVILGIINGFILTGALAPIAIYLSVSAFAYDVVIAVLRAYIELNRVYELREHYMDMYYGEENEAAQIEILDYLRFLDNRIQFEVLRFSLHVSGTVAIFLGMALALPILSLNPIIPFVGAVWLVVICISSYGLTQILETHRPLDAVEKPSSLASLGIFSKKPSAEPSRNEPDDLVPAM